MERSGEVGMVRGNMKRPEILAPAGDYVCMQAAIDAGAGAVMTELGEILEALKTRKK